tara:strand:+ start:10005 stop:10370 length:366 start_codon:yes stop_codon:yes gene_type:complete
MYAYISNVFLRTLYRQKGYGLLLFTRVIFSTCEFSQEFLAIAKLALSFFMPKNGVVLNTVILKVDILKVDILKVVIFKVVTLKPKRTFFHIPPTENHSFQTCFVTVISYAFCRYNIRQFKQ